MQALKFAEESKMATQTIRVLVADDHPVVRDGLKLFLSLTDGLEWVGEAVNGEQAVNACAMNLPDVVLMDMVMPVMDGLTATRLLHEKFPNIKVIALTSFDDKAHVRKAIEAGAVGFLYKNAEMSELAEAIRSAYAGNIALSPEATHALVKAPSAAPAVGIELTDRERQVLLLVAQGLTNQQIADRLNITMTTARFHVSNILSKLGAANRTEAVRIATQAKLL